MFFTRLLACLLLMAGLLAFTLAVTDTKTGWWPPFVPNVPVPGMSAVASPAVTEALTIEDAECVEINGFRPDWNRPISLAADDAMKPREDYTHLIK